MNIWTVKSYLPKICKWNRRNIILSNNKIEERQNISLIILIGLDLFEGSEHLLLFVNYIIVEKEKHNDYVRPVATFSDHEHSDVST